MDDIRVGGAIAKVASALISPNDRLLKRLNVLKSTKTLCLLQIYCDGKAFAEQYELKGIFVN